MVSNFTSPLVSSFTAPDGPPDDLGWPTADTKTVIHLTKEYDFSTHLRDAYGNPIKERQLSLITEVEGQGQKLYSTG